MRSILFLSDSVNRRFLKLYNESGLFLPNLDRLARRSVIFENHWAASAPCMPARRDLMTGRINFLERNWGPIEPFDQTLPQILRTKGIRSHIITDHYHYFEIGGENYCQMFDSWDFVRGQEWDPCCSQLKDLSIPEHLGKLVPQCWYNHQNFKDSEKKYPSPVVITKAAEWLTENHDAKDFFLWIEPFDPHEPFDVPEKYLAEAGDTYRGLFCMWPEYKQIERSDLTPEAVEHLRKRYLALLLMTDHYLGKIFDVMDRFGMWDDTMFVYTTDHGYMLGEHGYMAKNYMPAYNEVFHIPLIIHLPGDEHAGERRKALTENIDMLPTLMECYGIDHAVLRNKIHGRSLLPVLRGEKEKVRDAVLYGYFGKQMNVTDGHFTYFRSPDKENRPLNLYTDMPTDIRVYFDATRITDPTRITAGRFLPWTNYPVFKIPADVVVGNDDGTLRYVWLYDWEMQDQLYDLDHDYAQKENLIRTEENEVLRMKDLMISCMKELDSPAEQFERLKLTE